MCLWYAKSIDPAGGGWGSRRGLDADGPTCGNELSAATVPSTPETQFTPPHWTNQVPSPMEYRAPPSPSALGDLGRACVAPGWPRGPSISQPPWPWSQGCSPPDSPSRLLGDVITAGRRGSSQLHPGLHPFILRCSPCPCPAGLLDVL